MAQPPRPGDSHGNLLWKITENTFEGGGGGGGISIGALVLGSTPDRVLQTGPLGQLESGAVTTTELGFLAGATSNLQVQINALSGGVPGIESLADATAIWLTADELVGIGTSAPTSLLEIKARAPLAGTGTISSSGTAVTGVGTSFLTQLHVGDIIIAQGQPVIVLVINSNTSLVSAAAFVPGLAASAFTYQLPIEKLIDSSGSLIGFTTAEGNVVLGDIVFPTSSPFPSSQPLLGVSYFTTDPFFNQMSFSAVGKVAAVAADNSFRAQVIRVESQMDSTNTRGWGSQFTLMPLTAVVTVNAGASTVAPHIVGARCLDFRLSNLSATATIVNAYGIVEEPSSAVGIYTNFAGIALQNRTVATNNTNLLISAGSSIVNPAGNFSIYNGSSFNNYFQGSFGIGTSVPDGKLHVFSGSAGTLTPDTFADDLVIENSTFVGLTFACPNDTVATIAFADPQDSDVGSLNYNHSLNVLSVKVNALEYVYFNGAQVGIGSNSFDGRLHVFTASAGAVTSNAFADELVLENNDHCGLTILCPSTFVGTIFFGDESDNDVGQISYNHSLDTLTLTAGTVNVVNCVAAACNPGADNTIRLGSAAVRWTEVFAVAGTINTSDAREKNTILGVSLTLAQNLVDNIIPRSYVWNNKQLPGTHYGFVAQEIEAVVRRFVDEPDDFAPLHYDKASDQYGLRMNELLPFLWRVVQDQQKRIQTLEYAYGH